MIPCSSDAAGKIPGRRGNICRIPIQTLWCLGSTFLLGLSPSQILVSPEIDLVIEYVIMGMDKVPKTLGSIGNPTVIAV